MSVSKRSSEAESDIKTARAMPSSWEAGTGADKTPDTQQCRDAEAATPSNPGAPSKLPGYGGGK
jgi:hypothetical protein